MAVSARSILLIWIVIAAASSPASGTCVLDSDFGFTLNCGFKQSGLFRVRNLGGVKGFFGLGFSVGDELGFRQSLSNVEGNRRRSTQGAALGLTPTEARSIASQRTTLLATPLVQTPTQSLYAQRTISTQQNGVLPPFKPIPVSSYPTRMNVASNSSAVAQGGAAGAAAAAAASRKRSSSPSADVSASVIRTVKAPTLVAVPVGTTTRLVPAFQTLPQSSISRTSDAGEDFRTSLGEFIKMPTRGVTLNAIAPPSMDTIKITAVKPDSLSTRTLASSEAAAVKPTASTKLTPTSIGQSMEAIAKASNVSVQTVASAIAAKLKRRQQALEQVAKDANAGAAAVPQVYNAGVVIKKQQPKPPALVSSRGMVMNAPREYYPVGYDKDFDDGFAARVDLPDTSFSCGQQKHFPGLYADEDLGCMVFHVCALTDDGLIMKSFLCPESTLFDQTILKCNWWFYVDCKSSRKLYDSNIPVSKSYQLMKALAFFSSYKS